MRPTDPIRARGLKHEYKPGQWIDAWLWLLMSQKIQGVTSPGSAVDGIVIALTADAMYESVDGELLQVGRQIRLAIV